MKEQPKGEIIIIEPTEPETPEHLMKRIFGMTPREYAEKLIKDQQNRDVKNNDNIKADK